MDDCSKWTIINNKIFFFENSYLHSLNLDTKVFLKTSFKFVQTVISI